MQKEMEKSIDEKQNKVHQGKSGGQRGGVPRTSSDEQLQWALMTSLLVARCQRPCVSSLGDFGPPGAMIHVPAPEQSAGYPLYMDFTEDGPHC